MKVRLRLTAGGLSHIYRQFKSGALEMDKTTWDWRFQTTQPTSGGAVTADTNCCENGVETSRPQQSEPDLSFFRQVGHVEPLMAGAASHKSG